MKIVKTINISSDLKQISFDVKLCNTLAVALDGVGYRWHLIPAAWSNRNHGYIKCKDQKFNRPYHRMLLTKDCDPASEKRIRSLFEVIRPTEKIWNNQFEFVIPHKTVMESIFLPAENFAGAAVWDTMEMIAPTFEPFYQPRMIEPNGSISCKAEFKITEEI